jgi:molybdate transport system permease protein
MDADWSTLWLAARAAGDACALSVAAGLWLAWLLENRRFAGQRTLAGALSVGVALPAPALCYCLLCAAASRWPPPEAGMVAAGFLSGLPMFTRLARGALAGADPMFAKAAHSLGASDARVFVLVELLPAWRPMLQFAALTFARIFAEFAAASWIQGGRP